MPFCRVKYLRQRMPELVIFMSGSCYLFVIVVFVISQWVDWDIRTQFYLNLLRMVTAEASDMVMTLAVMMVPCVKSIKAVTSVVMYSISMIIDGCSYKTGGFLQLLLYLLPLFLVRIVVYLCGVVYALEHLFQSVLQHLFFYSLLDYFA